MELLFYGSGASNFGDDLNLVLWKRVLPSWVFDLDDVALLGIGTIFTDQWTESPRIRGKRLFVLGSGAGYWPLPRDLDQWTVLALRGPLSAELIDRPELAATDAAALLAVNSPVQLSEKRNKVLFMPHHESLDGARWQEVAQQVGITLVNPQWPVDTVLSHFREARLVLTEAMHGAIVADALRIPWIPWASSPYHLPFKWIDWTMSLGLKYAPTVLPPSSAWGKWRFAIAAARARRKGIRSSLETMELQSPMDYVNDFRARYQGIMRAEKKKSVNRMRAAVRKSIILSSTAFDRGYSSITAEAVHKALSGPSFLSEDAIFNQRVEQLQEATREFVKLVS